MSEFSHHEPCPDCGSSDALAVYTSGARYCYACPEGQQRKRGTTEAPNRRKQVTGKLENFRARGVKARGISAETAHKFGYGWAELGGEKVQVARYTDAHGRWVASKARTKDKKFVWSGDSKACEKLWGRHLWRDSGRKVVITEGEIDAMSVSQVQGNRWPVVSLKDGAGSAKACIQAHLEWLESFDEVILMFDQDEAGQAAVQQAAPLLSPGKAKVASLPLKDANEMLVAGRDKELIDAIWGARTFRPDGVLSWTEMFDRASTAAEDHCQVEYPWAGLQEKLRGMRTGELVTLLAGSGIGKSTLMRELATHLVKAGERVGCVFLEESARETVLGLLSVIESKPLHLGEPDWDALRASGEAVFQDKLYAYDHWGSLASDQLVSRIRFLVRGLGCRWIILDHISIVVSGTDTQNERKDIDVLMTNLRSLTEETNCGMFLVSHVSRPAKGRDRFEEGGVPRLSDGRGSASIEQLSNAVIALGRNQAEGGTVAEAHVLKNRFASVTGKAGFLEYSVETGRYTEVAGKAAEVFEEQDY